MPLLISAGMKFRRKERSGMVYRHIPAHFEHWYNGKRIEVYEHMKPDLLGPLKINFAI
jgi:hypothetical protein